MRRPRVLAPLVAAFMIALSLERLGALRAPAAAALFLLLAIVAGGIAARGRRELEEAGAAPDAGGGDGEVLDGAPEERPAPPVSSSHPHPH